MKPCSDTRKNLTLLALDALDAADATELRKHTEQCAGCREYLKEVTQLARALSAKQEPEIQPAEQFHRRVRAAITELPRPSTFSLRDAWHEWLFSWRAALPLAAGLGLLILLLVGPAWREHRVADRPNGIAQRTVPGTENMNAPMSLARYQSVAHRSLDDLDALLTEQGINSSVPGPPATASLARAARNFN